MKFVFFGYDASLPGLERLLDDGHELLGIFSFECDNLFNFNNRCLAIAQKYGAPFILSPAEDFHLQNFINQGAECFLICGYPHKVPPIDEQQAYAVNIHPSRLPLARGLMPVPRIIMDNLKDAAGFTAHKMTQKFDAGDIVLQEVFDLDPRETVETYSAKIAMRSPDFFSKLMRDLPALWKAAKPQNEKKASWLKPPTEEQRFLDWEKTTAQIDRTGRAFGRFGSLARFENQIFVVYDYDFWIEKHSYKPGTCVATSSNTATLAAKDGFICLKDFQLLKA